MPIGKAYPELLTSESLDEQHKKVLAFVAKFQAEKRYGPDYDQIADGTGINYSTARSVVLRLLKSGYLVRPDGVSRALRCASEEEHGATLREAWMTRLRALPVEELSAVTYAAGKVNAERVTAAGEPP